MVKRIVNWVNVTWIERALNKRIKHVIILKWKGIINRKTSIWFDSHHIVKRHASIVHIWHLRTKILASKEWTWKERSSTGKWSYIEHAWILVVIKISLSIASSTCINIVSEPFYSISRPWYFWSVCRVHEPSQFRVVNLRITRNQKSRLKLRPICANIRNWLVPKLLLICSRLSRSKIDREVSRQIADVVIEAYNYLSKTGVI